MHTTKSRVLTRTTPHDVHVQSTDDHGVSIPTGPIAVGAHGRQRVEQAPGFGTEAATARPLAAVAATAMARHRIESIGTTSTRRTRHGRAGPGTPHLSALGPPAHVSALELAWVLLDVAGGTTAPVVMTIGRSALAARSMEASLVGRTGVAGRVSSHYIPPNSVHVFFATRIHLPSSRPCGCLLALPLTMRTCTVTATQCNRAATRRRTRACNSPSPSCFGLSCSEGTTEISPVRPASAVSTPACHPSRACVLTSPAWLVDTLSVIDVKPLALDFRTAALDSGTA
jgi:hypothetical protein